MTEPRVSNTVLTVDYGINNENQRGFIRAYDANNNNIWASWALVTSPQIISEVAAAKRRCLCSQSWISCGELDPGMLYKTLKGIECENGCFNHITF